MDKRSPAAAAQDVGAMPVASCALYLCLCALYIANYLDRSILAILAESIRADLRLPDISLGALSGPAFFLVYGLLGLVAGNLADRADRLRLVRYGAIVWSLSCAAAGLATGAAQLIVTRAGVALGEAMATPAAVSLLTELVRERHRGFAASLYFSGAFIGAGGAAMLGGAILAGLEAHPWLDGWRIALACASVPGLLGALLLKRLERRQRPRPAARGLSRQALVLLMCAAVVVALQLLLPAAWAVPLATLVAAVVPHLWMRHAAAYRQCYAATLGERRFRRFVLGMAAVCFMDFAAAFWLLPLAQREFSVAAGLLGNACGVLMLVGGIAGALSGGWIADRTGDRTRGRLRMVIGAALVEALALLGCLHATSVPLFLAMYAAFSVAAGAWVGVAAATGLDLLPREHRAFGTAVYFWVIGLAGASLGPFLVGWISDHLGSLALALHLAPIAVLPAVAWLWTTGRLVRAPP